MAVERRTVERRTLPGRSRWRSPRTGDSTCGQDMIVAGCWPRTGRAPPRLSATACRGHPASIGAGDRLTPFADAGEMLGDVARLPDQVRQLRRKIGGYAGRLPEPISSTRRLLENTLRKTWRIGARFRSLASENGFIPIRLSFQVISGPSIAPIPSVTQATPQPAAPGRHRAPSRTPPGSPRRRRSRSPSAPHRPPRGSAAARSRPAPWSASRSPRCRRSCRGRRAPPGAHRRRHQPPIENDSARLTHDHSRMVWVRPQRSAMVPPTMLPAMLAT